MSQPLTDDRDDLSKMLLTMRIIWGALIGGPLFFLAIIVFVIKAGHPFSAAPWQVTVPMGLMALVFAGMLLVLSFVIPDLTAANNRRQLARGNLPAAVSSSVKGPISETLALAVIYQTRLIVGLALLEGAAFFCMIVFLLEGSALSLIAALVLLLVEATRFPTEPGLSGWIEDQRSQMIADREVA